MRLVGCLWKVGTLLSGCLRFFKQQGLGFAQLSLQDIGQDETI